MTPFQWAAQEWKRLAAEAEVAVEASYQAAEDALSPALLSPEGNRRGIDPRSLWSMPRHVAERYASEELREWWNHNGRPTITDLVAQMFDADLTTAR